jgi:hypothetical protein
MCGQGRIRHTTLSTSHHGCAVGRKLVGSVTMLLFLCDPQVGASTLASLFALLSVGQRVACRAWMCVIAFVTSYSSIVSSLCRCFLSKSW